VNELWQEICFLLQGNISHSISEEMYEQKIIQSLEKLGWSQFRKEIILKQSIQIGSVGRIIPDIIVKSLNNNESFVIEVKKPSVDIENNSHQKQLFSYMRQLKLENGLLIGNKMQIYYDGKSNTTEEPILLRSIDLSESSKDGLLFIDLFHKNNFSYQHMQDFAEKTIKELATKSHKKKLHELLLSLDYCLKLQQFIIDDLQENWDKDTIKDVLNQLDIYISPKSTDPSTPISPAPILSPDIKIGQLVKSSLNLIIAYCEKFKNELSNLESATYSKATFDINYPFLKKVASSASKQDRYWKDKYKINGQYYVVTSEWYKGSISLFKAYVNKISQHQSG
jgi:hypothetical protein